MRECRGGMGDDSWFEFPVGGWKKNIQAHHTLMHLDELGRFSFLISTQRGDNVGCGIYVLCNKQTQTQTNKQTNPKQ